ncbi:MAG: hypothetical protein HYR56_19885 [Acidobacteria bacterium]|nr:hypothetical protein [Acidobacteriota bacterium]MBI3421905.1 hypothetical protein [Acidobacteriota bacterium]
MTTLEQTIETIKAMPLADRQRLQQWLREQAQHDEAAPRPDTSLKQTIKAADLPPQVIETVEQQLERFHQARKWLDEHRTEFSGQWVALEGDRLISHGTDALQVHRAAKAAGVIAPFLEHVIEAGGENEGKEAEPYWGGWLS